MNHGATLSERRARIRKQDRHLDRNRGRRPFAGVDGEGGNIALEGTEGLSHEYLLLRAGDHVLETGEPLSTMECLRFLADLPNDVIYVAFFFDYDVTMMLRDIEPPRLARLLDTDCRRIPGRPCSSFALDWGPFQLDYVPRKEFRVRRRKGRHPETGKILWTTWTIINDCGSFFQTSFVKALTTWLGSEPGMDKVIAQIAEGKEQRAEFGHVTQDEREYNKLECILLARVMEMFREMCDRVNIRPGKWQGPGNLVSAVMKREGMPRNSEIKLFDDQPDVVRMANDGYYGGRFEVSRFGEIPGPIYQYDINSAYANTYRLLPCLLHGRWIETKRLPVGGIYVGQVQFSHKRGLNYCTLPLRGKNDGVLLFPEQGSGTYWSPELEVAKQYAELEWKGGYRYVPDCDCTAFDWVYDIYRERKRMGSQGTGKVLKLVLASTYGKLAQSVGCAPYSNPMWASLIVSNVRAVLISAALSVEGGKHVVMLATDGIFTTKPIPGLPLGTELGEWDLQEHENLFTVQSGIYFIPGKAPKTRGTPQRRVLDHEQDFRDTWRRILRTGSAETVSIPLNTFIGLRLALARGKPNLAGTWVDITKEIGFDWHTKRFDGIVSGNSLVTRPIPGSPQLVSAPYSRVIGGIRAAERLEFADQPEWAPQLL